MFEEIVMNLMGLVLCAGLVSAGAGARLGYEWKRFTACNMTVLVVFTVTFAAFLANVALTRTPDTIFSWLLFLFIELFLCLGGITAGFLAWCTVTLVRAFRSG